MKNLLCIFFLMVLFNAEVFAAGQKDADIIVKLDEGMINFTERYVIITATGTPGINISTLNTARIDAEKTARRNLTVRLEKALSKLILENGISLGKYLSERKETGFFTGLIKKEDIGEPVSSNYYSDGSADLQYNVPISKYLDQIKLKTMPDICKDEKVHVTFPEEIEGAADARKDVLVLEIKNGKLDPALYLKIENEKGELVYSSCISKTVHPMMIMKDPGRLLDALGSKDSFMTVNFLKIKNGSTVVIKNTDSEKILNEMKQSSLKEGKVIFLIRNKEGK
jgi:hypothetical protein